MASSVRPLRPDEWRVWRDLRLRALADSPDAFGEALASAQLKDDASWVAWTARHPSRVHLLAEHDGVPVGIAVIAIEGLRANLYAMWVSPEARGVGLGRALVDAALGWARARAVLEVGLRVSERQPKARRLYLAAGFADTGVRSRLRDGSELTSDVLVARQPPLIMGVVNVTPDSFTDGGAYLDPGTAVAHGQRLIADGADILDIGGEATNPRATPVTADEELRRVMPIIEQLAAMGVRLSIDTTKAKVAREAVRAGASIVNDVSGGLFDPAMAATLADLEVTYIAGHLRGRSLPEVFSAEEGVPWPVVAAELGERLAALPPSVTVWVDPGIGFGKGPDPEGNLQLLRHAGDISRAVGRPIVVGPSRKRFLRRILGGAPDLAALDIATVAASLAAVHAGAHVVRTHNVALLRTALTVYTKV
ncbi:MAG: dihydropteroate synthase [Myxococcales bacterium]|nr:dihydropteroate synthase [Myxococcales bacterium]